MESIRVRRYAAGPQGGYTGWIEPEDSQAWIVFTREDGEAELYERDKTGAIV